MFKSYSRVFYYDFRSGISLAPQFSQGKSTIGRNGNRYDLCTGNYHCIMYKNKVLLDILSVQNTFIFEREVTILPGRIQQSSIAIFRSCLRLFLCTSTRTFQNVAVRQSRDNYLTASKFTRVSTSLFEKTKILLTYFGKSSAFTQPIPLIQNIQKTKN